MLQCNTNATLGNLLQQNCNTEIEKEIDIELEKEGERKKQSLPPTLYGEYKNIRLTDEEYQNLKGKLQEHTDTMIEKLSRYIKSKGTDYKDHYVTILNWYEQDKEKLSQKKTGKIPTIEDYDKGEHL